MIKDIKKIKIPIIKEMEIFENKINKVIKSHIPLLDCITRYIFRRKGKQIRPMLVFLIAKMLGNITTKTYNIALLIELIHTGTLVHDDIVDDSYMRRGFFSIHTLWKNKIAVLIGDYFLAKSLLLATNHNDYHLIKIISHVIQEMSKGELLQIEKTRRLDITENIYNQIIHYKTASLISACCEGGASSVNANKSTISQMKKFGKLIGMAFQIKNDLFDYENNNLLGDSIGLDIKDRKITLPLIHVLEKSNIKDKKWIINIINNHNKDIYKVRELINYVKQSGGIDYAIKKIETLCKNALIIINQYPESLAKDSLKIMVYYITNLKK